MCMPPLKYSPRPGKGRFHRMAVGRDRLNGTEVPTEHRADRLRGRQR
jgi:hypothetical protein